MSKSGIWSKFVRWLLRTYKREIKKFVAQVVERAIKDELKKHVNKVATNKIKNDVIRTIVDNKIDIYTSSGAEYVKAMVNGYIDKLDGGD